MHKNTLWALSLCLAAALGAFLQSGGMTDEQIDALVAIIRGKST